MAFNPGKSGHGPDSFLLVLTVLLILGGLAILASASSDLGRIKFNDSYYYLKHQLFFGLSIGLLGFFIGYFFNYQNWRKFAVILLAINLILLVLVFVKPFGVTSGGASRWLEFGPVRFQPAELLKLSLILYLSAWFAARANRAMSFWHGLFPFLVICGVTTGLLVFQPATSTVFILLSGGGAIYFLSGAKWRDILLLFLICLVGFGSLIFFTPYRFNRITSFLDKNLDTQGANYQVTQSIQAVGSGGLFGMGYGKSTAKISLPAAVDDSIFAVVGQELGFVGAGFLAMLFGMLVFRLFYLANRVRDKFGKFTLVGFATIIAFQSIVNMGAISGLLPLTGVPLPFVSYGGTALAVFVTMSGISLNISRYTS